MTYYCICTKKPTNPKRLDYRYLAWCEMQPEWVQFHEAVLYKDFTEAYEDWVILKKEYGYSAKDLYFKKVYKK